MAPDKCAGTGNIRGRHRSTIKHPVTGRQVFCYHCSGSGCWERAENFQSRCSYINCVETVVRSPLKSISKIIITICGHDRYNIVTIVTGGIMIIVGVIRIMSIITSRCDEQKPVCICSLNSIFKRLTVTPTAPRTIQNLCTFADSIIYCVNRLCGVTRTIGIKSF